MRPTTRAVLLSFVLGACGDGGGGTTTADAGGTTAADAGGIESLAIAETKALTGLSANVEVVRDNRGTPHIYARNLPDAIRVQGYLMARDRFGQMEFLRRRALGRLAELAPLPQLVALDEDARFVGYEREGKAIYDYLPASSTSRQVMDAFAAGVNDYIDEVQAAPDKGTYIPPGTDTVFNILLSSPYFGHWKPSDLYALVRFQTTDLSYNPNGDIAHTRALAGVREKLDASRKGAYVDLFTEVQGRRVYTRPGFPAQQKPSRARPRLPLPALPDVESLDAALRWFQSHGRSGDQPFEGHGSNNWVVHGSKTASGAPILANDPHLPLVSPGVWWYVHINTKKYGGSDGFNVNGVAFAALPGVVLGFNDDIAWGATVSGFDVTDIYEETVAGGDTPTVLFNGNQVPIQKITEVIHKSGADDENMVIEVVPHHGPIVPGSRTGGTALSIKYTGQAVSDELAFFTGLAKARNVDEAWEAQKAFRTGGQNIVVVSRDGEIAWNTEVSVPVRDDRAVDLEIDADGTVRGHCPTFVLPGTGEYEWKGELPSALIPKDRNPTKGFIATANQDSVGVTDDNNPCNQPDHYYLGGDFAEGYREGRIVEHLTALTAAGGITKDQMIALQAETQSSLGDTLRDPLVTILERVTASGNGLFTADEKTQLADVKTRLAAWSRKTPHGVGATDPDEIADSIATTLFSVGLSRIIPLAFGDEATAIGVQPGTDRAIILIERSLTHPEMLATFDGQDTVLWDDVSTGAKETKDQIVGRGFLNALAFLRTTLGDDEQQWRWGRLHMVRFTSILPFADAVSIPPPSDPVFPDGFPRHGDYGAVDVGNYSMWAPGKTGFTHTSGPSQRLVVEMLPTGPRAYNALPGGQSIFTSSPHHDDEARTYWIKNQQPPVNFTETDVVKNAEARLRFTP